MKPNNQAEYEAWVASRPEAVQKAIAEFPFGTMFLAGRVPLYLIGFSDDGNLIVSCVDPAVSHTISRLVAWGLHIEHARSGLIRNLGSVDPLEGGLGSIVTPIEAEAYKGLVQ